MNATLRTSIPCILTALVSISCSGAVSVNDHEGGLIVAQRGSYPEGKPGCTMKKTYMLCEILPKRKFEETLTSTVDMAGYAQPYLKDARCTTDIDGLTYGIFERTTGFAVPYTVGLRTDANTGEKKCWFVIAWDYTPDKTVTLARVEAEWAPEK